MTNAQLLALKAAILADPTMAAMATAGETGAIANYLRGDSSFVVWKARTQTADINDAVIWANMTPADAPDATATYTNRALYAQAKQINLQILIQGQGEINSAKANIRAGLQDALTGLPTGPGGAVQAAGWVAVRLIMQRFATRFEHIFATGTGTQASPGTSVLDGWFDDYVVVQALTQV